MIEKNPFHQTGFGLDPNLLSDMRAILLAVVLILLIVALFWRRTRRRSGWRTGWRPKRHPAATILPFAKQETVATPLERQNMHLPEYQMRAIAAARFETQPLLNVSEARLLPVIEAALAEFGRGHRVMAQTSLGELLRPCKDQDPAIRDAAFASINSKRLDFSIIDRSNHIVAAIEYQGTGHHQDKAFIRDAVKREACRKAGVAFIEVLPGTLPSDLTEMVRKVVAPVATVRNVHRAT
jgi:hypothetical protein